MPADRDVEELLDRWKEASERGRPISVDDLCRTLPQLRDRLIQQIEAYEAARSGQAQPPTEAELGKLRVQADIGELVFLAQGGLGTVYLATERQLHRQVAVKFIHRRLAGELESQTRFLQEAEVTGRLEHPGVVPLYGVGQTENGQHFYYMRYIEGETLDQAIREFHVSGDLELRDCFHHFDFRRLLTSYVSVCKTVAYAHNRGIVHRDIKPQNVMLGRFGETIVVDWGLAAPVYRDDRFRATGELTLKPQSGSQSDTTSHSPGGTPAYMSPEQASGLAASPASDIYSLGATLYKILTGESPFHHENAGELKRRVIEGRFVRPRMLQRYVPQALEAICLKAMSLQPSNRYDTALDLARDVENYLGDMPVSALPEPWMGRLTRWFRRNRAVARTAAAGVVGGVLVSWLSSIWLGNMAHREQQARHVAESERLAADDARRQNLSLSAMFLARSIAYEIDLRWRILEAEANSPELRRLMQPINADPQNAILREPLQSWLAQRYVANQQATACLSWFINASEGTQAARVPAAPSIGGNYAHRDYFHALGRDLAPESPEVRRSTLFQDRPVHMSAVYESTNTHTLMVAFAVPIWDAPPEEVNRTRIGILCMAVELGDLAGDNNAMLADTRNDQMEGKPGLVLHHAQLGDRSRTSLPPRIDDETLRAALDLRSRRLSDSVVSSDREVRWIEQFRDPVTGISSLGAIEPVLVRGRNLPEADTGWVVIVREDVRP